MTGKVALIAYLQRTAPAQLDLLVRVHLALGLESQLADLLHERAHSLTNSLGTNWDAMSPPLLTKSQKQFNFK